MAGNEGIAKKLFDDPMEIPTKEPMKVFLRIRPLTTKECNDKEDEGCIIRRNDNLVELCAPSSSFTYKTSNHSFDESTHQFSFSHVFPEATSQKEFFDKTMLPFVKDIFDGHNGLVFTYGVTNSGKTYTVQGTLKDGGVIPRCIDVLFNSISDKMYVVPNIKPKLCSEVTYLTKGQEMKEAEVRNRILNFGEKENDDPSKKLNSTTRNDTTVIQKENTFFSDISVIKSGGANLCNVDIAQEMRSRLTDATSLDVQSPSDVKFGMWVSFMEIYNEFIHDLLDLNPFSTRKRTSLKLGEDKSGKPYVKGLREVFVTSSDEAYKVLRVGQRNRHMAATKLNQQSSRSHAIFSIKILKIIDGDKPHVSRINRLSIVDLAGSERYSKTDAHGGVLKEASNINCSIMTLGKCINTLRYNQEHPNHPTIVPFRESKLTRLFQSYFLGKGKASMIVNISPCASVFDETYNVLKFSAVAKEVKMKSERSTELWQVPPAPKQLFRSLSNAQTTPAQKRLPLCIVTPSTRKDRTLNDPTEFTYDELVHIVKELTEKVKKERKEKAQIEKNVRTEFSQEMSVLMTEMDETHRNELEDQKDSLNQLMEDRLDLLTKTAEKQRKRKRIEDVNENLSYFSNMDYETERKESGEMPGNLARYPLRIDQLEVENKRLRKMEQSGNEAEETLKIQNQLMEDMQKKLQDKDDEIEKLRDEMEKLREELEERTGYKNSTHEFESLEAKECKVDELESKLEVLSEDLEVAQATLQNRDLRIQQLERGGTNKYSLRKHATYV